MPKELLQLNKVCDELKKLKIKTAFLYGSRARGDYLKNSDYEIGVLFFKKDYLSRGKLEVIFKKYKNFNIYPFEYEKFIKGEIDTPFQKNIHLREIIKSGKTIIGDEIIKNIKPPEICIIDLAQDIRFNIGRSLDSIICKREGNNRIALSIFSKSCLFGTRDLIILKLKKFPVSYDEIYKLSKKLNLGNYKRIVANAYKIRKGGKIKKKDLFENLSYLNQFIEKEIIISYKKYSNKIIIK